MPTLEINGLNIAGKKIVSEDNFKVINFGIDSTYTSSINHPSFGVLIFRINIGVLGDYFKTGATLWGKIIAIVDTEGGIGRYVIEDEITGNNIGLVNLDINTITWVSETTVDIVLNGAPDLSSLSIGETLRIDSATNSSNNGQHIITAIDDGADKITVLITARTDNTDDEATDSPAIGETGSITQFTNNSLASVISNEFKLVESTYYRMKLNKTSGTDARVASAQLIIFKKD